MDTTLKNLLLDINSFEDDNWCSYEFVTYSRFKHKQTIESVRYTDAPNKTHLVNHTTYYILLTLIMSKT